MIYSVWNQTTRQYDYYRSRNTQHTANTPKPTHLKHRKMGATVNQAAWPLPAGAVRVGSGPYAKGRIASLSRGGAMGAFDLDTNFVMIAGLGLAAIVLFKSGFLSPKKR
jgi:hypothetical protein